MTRTQAIDILENYSKFLEKNGYMDTDWNSEPPYAIDEFLKGREFTERVYTRGDIAKILAHFCIDGEISKTPFSDTWISNWFEQNVK